MKTLIEHLEFALTVDAADTVIQDAALVIDNDRIGSAPGIVADTAIVCDPIL